MRFEKVSFEEYSKARLLSFRESAGELAAKIPLEEEYEKIILPRRATPFSAGYDFFIPYDAVLSSYKSTVLPTGIRWIGDRQRFALICVPRSGLGFKYGTRLVNTVGVIDADYCDSDNQGHIIISLINPSDVAVPLEEGKPFAQGIVVKYEVPDGAESEEARNGGFGSTDK